ncbi:hypothetical protein Ddye_020638 [Dipteronia dyeriana]|uniref:MULE transposase domain-containing protein n=1 Tax=Dipteronia dyeriana TaxID=168575 RepID=A0AAD9U0X4_9ROSI|nr:hypothetical protein Ddye_020638 [Dipteronia dyeriana]
MVKKDQMYEFKSSCTEHTVNFIQKRTCSFKVSMLFGTSDIFRKAIRAHVVKHMRDVKFQKNDKHKLRIDTNVDASKWQFYCAMHTAKEIINGDVKEQYSKLREYALEVMRMNPDTTILLNCDDSGRFQRMYICLGALKEGWKQGCMPLLGLDGCFTKGYHIGQLLITIGVDENNQMNPVAYALVEAETKDIWGWFLDQLASHLELNNSFGIVCISDKQKRLIDAIVERFPNSEHKFCVKHLYNNFKAQHRGLLLKQILWGAAKATTQQDWKGCKALVKSLLQGHSLRDMECNNICEAFNAAILAARDKQIITILEMIRNYIMTRLVRKRIEVEKWSHEIGPKVFRFVEKVKQESVYCYFEYSGNSTYQVRARGDEQFVVGINDRTCG